MRDPGSGAVDTRIGGGMVRGRDDRGDAPVQLYFIALLVLSAGAVIEARCTTPGLRPAAEAADRAFRFLGRAAFGFCLVLLAWGFATLPWWLPVAGIAGSLALNALIVQGGARPYWPGLSMALSFGGLFLAAMTLAR